MDQAEKLRSVVKLKKQNYKPDARVITVTSGKGGVGKSNVAVNLAVQMQKMGKRVLVLMRILALPMSKYVWQPFPSTIWQM